ncbi:DUF397 domain-containing protein [Streptomyces sp. NPDC058614]|uniref:DUF397 domain-containing protein n=1 Tax=Streptomyces sp. NPDC058614 TaxID=3346557 RepID=UPI0036659AA3
MSKPRMGVAVPHDVDLSEARWRKSSYSGGANDCVELADLGMHVAVRDSKNTDVRPLLFERSALHALVSGIASGTI